MAAVTPRNESVAVRVLFVDLLSVYVSQLHSRLRLASSMRLDSCFPLISRFSFGDRVRVELARCCAYIDPSTQLQ